ncbi:AGZA family xanthine/uracil permease-like MFS transporter [Sinobaca qinghaiensis]|uniref:AGZA family xanthine/uracil permease-like MFS transporter n=1 Tax=Sinobaca qinghaiensis TaxID=342944 RepID=A0A419UWD5_9BACL|nr:NCS2 family permease [Sinobaca qinghaiensis]RKD69441.1 AGZA family xanthine/uracil permease-like MFS transporter [Sinobaca qinghaiensis]
MNAQSVHYPWFKRQDLDAFFALFQNNLANFVVITVTMLGMGFPASVVFGKVIPGTAVAVMAGNLYYSFMASRLAKKENRSDVTALSYGISTPVMFVFLFGVLAPALALTNDPDLAWKIAVAAAFISGLIEAMVSLTGNWIRDHLPRPALLGALAGVAFSFIAGEMLFHTFAIPVVGLVALAIILVGFVGKVVFPFRMPASLLAVVVGTILAFALGHQSPGEVSEGLSNVGFYPIVPSLAAFDGMTLLFGTAVGLLGVLLPITIYNAIETMNNVEAMAAVGDSYDVRECQAVDGTGTMLGAVFGGLFPTTVYIATIGSKEMGAGRGYSILNAFVILAAAVTGMIAALSALIPLAAIAPVLVFVGMSMVAAAFSTTSSRYFPAVALAMLPYLANYTMTRFNNPAGDVVADISEGIVPLGQGALFTAILLGAVTVSIIDREWRRAVIFTLTAAVFSFAGFMHAPALAWNAAPDFTAGYLAVAVFFGFCAWQHRHQSQLEQPDKQERQVS